jgi:hypothetical protein
VRWLHLVCQGNQSEAWEENFALQKKLLAKKAVPIDRPNKKDDKPNEDKSSKKFRKA